jgi:MFS family permease
MVRTAPRGPRVRWPARHASRAGWAALLPLLLGTFTGTVANSVVNAPMHLIIGALGVPLAAASLVVTAFTLTFAVLMPLTGWLGDRFGHRRVFCGALALLMIGSAGAALAPDLPTLLVFRVLQGAGTAAVLPTVMALIAVMFDQDRRGRALGLWASVNGAGQAAGPALGGALATWFGWRAIFWPAVPFALTGLVLTLWLVPADHPWGARSKVRLDWGGALLLTFAAIGILGSASAVAPLGAASPVVWTMGLLGFVAAFGYVLVARGRPGAFLPPRLILEVRYLRSCLAVLAQMFCLGALLLAIPLYLTGQRDASTLAAGGVLLATPLAMAVCAPLSGLLMERLGARPTLRTGLLAIAAGQIMLAALTTAGFGIGAALPAVLAFVGVGVAFVQTPAANGATRSRAGRLGAGLGLFNLLRFGGSALGAAWVAAVLDHTPAFSLVFGVGAAMAGIGLLGSFVGRDPEARASSGHPGDVLDGR